MTRPSLALALALAALAGPTACQPFENPPQTPDAASDTEQILAASDLPPTLAAPLPGDGMGGTDRRCSTT